ncbi:MAG: thioredoxin fold domain-containing protein [Chlorobiota bacterium]|jgi:thioredoxin-related protein|nr:thioredoxin fold domain-containing protein [Chlorobiota bacterium]QQS66540.1 MAG: thioredoxin fold domain-containing protein [Chlorobiota bacterium]
MKVVLQVLSIVIVVFSLSAFSILELSWSNVENALPKAITEKKLVVIDVYTDWCGWCKRMDRDTYSNEEVVKYLNKNFIASKMNPEKEGSLEFNEKKYTYSEFNKALGITGYPATAFVDREGKLLTVVSGYYSPKDFLKVIKYFGEDIYKSTKWDDYTNKKD